VAFPLKFQAFFGFSLTEGQLHELFTCVWHSNGSRSLVRMINLTKKIYAFAYRRR
jgi:hypothetical protein